MRALLLMLVVSLANAQQPPLPPGYEQWYRAQPHIKLAEQLAKTKAEARTAMEFRFRTQATATRRANARKKLLDQYPQRAALNYRKDK